MSRPGLLLACSLLTAPAVGDPRPAPAWANTSWLNADQPLRLDELRGRVVLLNFWVFTCGNCTRTVPSLVDFDRRYRNRGLTVIGIHTPEFPPYAGEHDRATWRGRCRSTVSNIPNAQDNDREPGICTAFVLAQFRPDRQERSCGTRDTGSST